eukprot:scaffold4901_cov105-Cylindrotheca_fusiformis.AAC.4
MHLFSALSALLILLDSQKVGSQSFSLLQGENPVNPSSSQKIRTAPGRKSKDFEIVVANSPNDRWLSTSSSWVKAAAFLYLDDMYIDPYWISISGDGTFLAVAVENDNIVRFFQKQESDGSWKEMTNLGLSGDAETDCFGSHISLSEDGKRVAIGARNDTGASDELDSAGSVSVYEMNSDGSEWLLMGDVIHGKSKNGASGVSVALSKDGLTVAIGATGNDGTVADCTGSGHVRVFRWDAGASAFDQLGGDIVGGDIVFRMGDQFAVSVAVSDDGLVVAIGAPFARDEDMLLIGRVHVYYWDESDGGEKKWSRRGSIIDADSTDGWFGNSIDLSGDGNIVAVGAPFASRMAGEAQVFQWKDDDWVKIGQTLEGTDGYRNFGLSVSLSSDGSILAVSSGDGSSCTYPDHPVMVFTLVDNQWEELGGAVSGTAGSKVSLSSNGETIAFGYPEDDGDFFFVYDLVTTETTSGPTSDPTSGPTSDPSSAAPPSPAFLLPFLVILAFHAQSIDVSGSSH